MNELGYCIVLVAALFIMCSWITPEREVTVTVKGNRAFAFGDSVWPGAAKVVEESGEVLQVLGKLLMTHGDPAHWSGDLIPLIEEEIADLEAAISVFKTLNLDMLDVARMTSRTQIKIETYLDWHDEGLGL